MLNASNFSRNASVIGAKKLCALGAEGNRKARRKAASIAIRAALGSKLDDFNERQSDRTLHPTKGWRKINTKRTVASTIVSMAAQGFLGSNLDMKEAFANA